MKSLKLTAMALVAFFCACNENNDPGPVPGKYFDGMNGAVDSVVVKSYTAADRDGRMVPDACLGKVVTHFDEDGHLLVQKGTNPDGTLFYTLEMEWKDGQVVSSRENRFDESAPNERKVISRKKGKVIIEEKSDEKTDELRETWDGTTLRRTDSKGRLVLMRTFDGRGNVTSEKKFKEGELSVTRLSEFDQEGNIVRYSEINGHDFGRKTLSYKYFDFDEKGNWTTRTSLDNAGRCAITIREIAYRQPIRLRPGSR